MKAIVQDRYGPPSALRLDEIDKPRPGPGELLVRVRAAGVDPGVWHLATGLPYLVRLGFGLRKPRVRVAGRDVAGEVEEAGENVTGFKTRDEVFGVCDGAYAEYALVRQDRADHKPAGLTFEQAAALPVSACAALHAVRDAGRVEPGQRALIIGASGGVGTFAVQLAKAFGAHVTGVCSTAKSELVRAIGADDVIDYTREDLAGRGPYDLVIDIAGNRPLPALRRLLTRSGTLVIVGGEGGGRWTGGFGRSLRAPVLSLIASQRLRGLISTETTADLRFLRELVEAGKVTPIIDRSYPLGQAAAAVERLRQGHARGKMVVTV